MELPCDTCPFKDMTRKEKHIFVECEEDGGMLCHESQCLDGNIPDRLCIGFYNEVPKKEETI
jgi:hypothetical protein